MESAVVSQGAELSPDRIYRYRLWRRWGDGTQMTFIGLNPSTADENVDDHTIRKCIGFAKLHGCDAIEMLNLFALRERNPNLMKKHLEPIGPDNNRFLTKFAREAKIVVACWGVHGSFRERSIHVIELFKNKGIKLSCFGMTQRGYPRHPLLLPYTSQLVEFRG